MIQPNEKLLPGNVVMCRDKACILTSEVVYNLSIGRYDPALFSPIPLTPEILVQWCGFKERDNSWFYKKYFTDCDLAAEVMAISINANSGRCGTYNTESEELGGAFTGKIITDLHHLQNFFYFLTGEEMPVNIPNH